jgi:hypothetical protein
MAGGFILAVAFTADVPAASSSKWIADMGDRQLRAKKA